MELGTFTSRDAQDQDDVQTVLRDTLSTIYLGDVIKIWQDQRQICVGSHAEFAKHLLAVHKEYCVDYCRAESQDKAVHLSLCTNNQCTHRAHDEDTIDDQDSENIESKHDALQEEETEQTMDATHEADGVDVKPILRFGEIYKNKTTILTDEEEKPFIGPGDEIISSKLEILNVYTRRQAIAMSSIDTQDTFTIKEEVDEDTQDMYSNLIEGSHDGSHTYVEQKKSTVRHRKLNRMTPTGKMPHVCSDCGKGFIRKTHLTSHEKVHTDIKPHVCSDCGRAFKYLCNMKAHMNTHKGVKPYICPDCGKGFSTKQIVIRHLETHVVGKPHVCPDCNKGFKHWSSLKIHMTIHTGDWPHACPECGKGFNKMSKLKSHMMTHTGELADLSYQQFSDSDTEFD